MWIAYSIMQLCIQGSVFLIVLLLLRWGGIKWRRLKWLTRDRKRWLMIWSCYGLVRQIVLVALLLFIDGPGLLEVNIERLGWPTNAIPVGFPAPLVVLLGGIAEAIINCVFAALAWWLSDWWVPHFRAAQKISIWEKYGMSLFATVWFFGLANFLVWPWQFSGGDILNTYGVPFIFYETGGGFVGFRRFVWNGVIENILAMIGAATIIAIIWLLISRSKLPLNISRASSGKHTL